MSRLVEIGLMVLEKIHQCIFANLLLPLHGPLFEQIEFPSLKDASYQVWLNEEQLSELIPLTFALSQIWLMFGSREEVYL